MTSAVCHGVPSLPLHDLPFMEILIQLLGGAVGGNLFGKLFKNLSLGTIGNSIAGILGGGIGGQLLGMLGVDAAASGELDIASILQTLGASGAGGGTLMAVVGLVKKAMSKG